MFTSILDAVTRTPRRALTTAAVATVIAALPAAAQARDHGLRFSVSVPVVVDPCPPQPVVYAPEAGRVWVEPAYRTVCDRQWIEPTYRTVDAQVWVPPVTTTQTQRVYVPDQLGWRTVVSVDRWGRSYRQQQWVVVNPAHYEDRGDAVVVTPGHYATVQQQQLVCDGHWADVDRQELVTPGHWETVVAAPAWPAPRPELRVRLPF